MNSVAFATAAAGKIIIREEISRDFLAREALLDRAFGLDRWRKTSERLREGRLPAQGLSFSALRDGVLVGTLRFWPIEAGEGRDALLLGPIAVGVAQRAQGLGGALIRLGLERARAFGHKAVLLVGDAPYYQRFGFSQALTENLGMPGPVNRARFLALELQEGALAGAQGMLRPAGALAARERGWIRAA
jgi:predicted N-acetyltransferase YhbS